MAKFKAMKKSEVSLPRVLLQQITLLDKAAEMALQSHDHLALVEIAQAYTVVADLTQRIVGAQDDPYESPHDIASGQSGGGPRMGFAANYKDMKRD